MSVKTELEKGSLVPEVMRGDLQQATKEQYPELIAALMDLAKGAWYEEIVVDKKTKKPYVARIYQRLPDKEVATYLLNQQIGKPKENASMAGRVNFIMDE